MTELSFSFGEVAQLVLFAFAVGVIFQRVTNLEKKQEEDIKTLLKADADSEDRLKDQVETVSARQETLENRFVKAIEDLNKAISGLTIEIKTALAVQDGRITHIEENHR
jgi:enoyl-[acyl-carrier-protein] reductase (NADH)